MLRVGYRKQNPDRCTLLTLCAIFVVGVNSSDYAEARNRTRSYAGDSPVAFIGKGALSRSRYLESIARGDPHSGDLSVFMHRVYARFARMDITDNDTCGGFSHGPSFGSVYDESAASTNFLTIGLTATSRRLFMCNYRDISAERFMTVYSRKHRSLNFNDTVLLVFLLIGLVYFFFSR